ncbi:hypothetical protein GCM10007887_34080 [Methylobacterium haplocladii]|uniref:Uncharacterized protein n=1 Tax=Methylobacterium haplocladii TaxID=1176176 RepID=A0A512IVR0_9HYPH|nr:hypothetical protein MHA02_41970 [Methylobacterium haplocladii]GLS60723.1 hypothetical protein GCM10007887_34080 [Methylobacterium haplocladii]
MDPDLKTQPDGRRRHGIGAAGEHTEARNAAGAPSVRLRGDVDQDLEVVERRAYERGIALDPGSVDVTARQAHILGC